MYVLVVFCGVHHFLVFKHSLLTYIPEPQFYMPVCICFMFGLWRNNGEERSGLSQSINMCSKDYVL